VSSDPQMSQISGEVFAKLSIITAILGLSSSVRQTPYWICREFNFCCRCRTVDPSEIFDDGASRGVCATCLQDLKRLRLVAAARRAEKNRELQRVRELEELVDETRLVIGHIKNFNRLRTPRSKKERDDYYDEKYPDIAHRFSGAVLRTQDRPSEAARGGRDEQCGGEGD